MNNEQLLKEQIIALEKLISIQKQIISELEKRPLYQYLPYSQSYSTYPITITTTTENQFPYGSVQFSNTRNSSLDTSGCV